MTEKKQACVYIDEAGDLGINRGTRWFVITGVIVAQEEAEKISECKDAFDLCEVLNEQESDSRWSYEEE